MDRAGLVIGMPCHERGPAGTDPSMPHDLWLAPVRNLVWVAAQFGHR
jgi:hypothetical protein